MIAITLYLSLSEEDRIHGGGEQCMLTLLADKANNGQPKKERMEGRKEISSHCLAGLETQLLPTLHRLFVPAALQ